MIEVTVEVGMTSISRFIVERVEDCDVLENFPVDPQSIQTLVENGGIFIKGFGDATLTVKAR